ncbi:MAG: RNA polymerase sigma-70 factor [Balneolaceae bacterium]|nr:RNA polymerase sigma-70 factor [Balneolaceae bacterium]
MSDLYLKNEKEWLKKLSQGSELAFTKIFDHYRPRIYSVALNMLKSSNQAEDVVQEVFLKIWTQQEKMININNLEGYLFMMARNNIYDRFKKLASERTARNTFTEIRKNTVNNTDHSLIEKNNYELLQQTLAILPPRQKQIYDLSRNEGMSYKQIGIKLDISHLTVKKHMSEALKFIRKHLETHIEPVILLPMLFGIFQ